ncbi:MAG TPA: M48 family metallopeptidase [Arenimonas sp.]|jgi:predicted Zn-dependent protease|nr:M48 family metallopeptidase [Arenimonas sp.]HPO24384.1 M48 family metallopeptidase [Arenimonas sp.]HPW33402.1 M48 family metallopeptidase [Arenimonas sp.]
MQQNVFGNQQSGGTGRRGGIRWWVIILFAGYAAWQWFGNSEPDPFTGEKAHYGATTDQEAQMGLQAFQQVLNEENPLPDNNPNAIAITAIAKRLVNVASNVEADLAAENNMASPKLAETFQWSVAVLESPQANAFCLPGGKMAVYTGLIPVAQNEDAMAVVMGHEIAHALLRHGSQRMAQQKLVQMGQMAAGVAIGDMDPNQQQMVMSALGAGTQYGLALPFGRSHETQADEVGLMLAAAACYDPKQAIPLWQRMSELNDGKRPPEFASTHPDPANRIAHLQALMPKAEKFYAKYCSGAK